MLRRMEKHDTATPSELTSAKVSSAMLAKISTDIHRNDRYYTVFRVKGKLIWKSLKTSDREFAKRKLHTCLRLSKAATPAMVRC